MSDMKHSGRRRLLLAGTGAALASAAFRSWALLREIPFATGEWPPFITNKEPRRGLLGELITEVVTEMGARPKFIFTSWPRAEAMVERGLAFAAFPYARTDERASRFDFSDPLLMTRTVLFYRRQPGESPLAFRKIDDLKRYRVGIVYGYFYESMFQQHGVKLEYASTELESLRLLLNDRVDLVPLEETVGWYIINQSLRAQAGEFGTLDTPLVDDVSNYLIVSRAFPESGAIRASFNQALDRLRREGRVDAILHRYKPKGA